MAADAVDLEIAADRGQGSALLEARVTAYAIDKKFPEGTFTPSEANRAPCEFDARVSVPIYKTDDKTGMLPPNEAHKTLAAIADAWSRRQAQTKSFKFTWEQDRIPLTRANLFPGHATRCVSTAKSSLMSF